VRPNHRFATVDPMTMVAPPEPTPTTRPQSRSMCQGCVIKSVPAAPRGNQERGRAGNDPGADAIHDPPQRGAGEAEQEHIDRDGQADRRPVPAELGLSGRIRMPGSDRTAAAVKRQTKVTARTTQA